MKHIMTVKFDSAKWRKVDEYKLAAMFIDIGFRQIRDIIELRVFDLLNISRINNTVPKSQKERLSKKTAHNVRQSFNRLSRRC